MYLDGGIVVNPDEVKAYKDKIKVIDLSPYNIETGEYGCRGFRRNVVNAPNELFIDSVAYEVSKYPKDDVIMLTEETLYEEGSKPASHDYECKSPVVRYNKELVKKWKSEKDMYVAGYPKWPWADDCLKVIHIDENDGRLTLKHPHCFGFQANHVSPTFIF